MFNIALDIANLSDDFNTKIGALLVREGQIIGYGWNHKICDLPDKKGFVHAEVHALSKGKGDLLICTWACCVDCAKMIVVSGIKKVITSKKDYPKWNSEIEMGHKVLRDNGVEIEFVDSVSWVGGKWR